MAIESLTKYTVVCDRCGERASSTGESSVERAIHEAQKVAGFMFSSWQEGEEVKHVAFCYRCIERVLMLDARSDAGGK